MLARRRYAAVRLRQGAQLHRHVIGFDRYIDPAAVGVDHQMDVRIADGERRNGAAQPAGAEIDRHADPQRAAQFGLHARGAEPSFFDFAGDSLAVLVETLPMIGDRQFAAAFS